MLIRSHSLARFFFKLSGIRNMTDIGAIIEHFDWFSIRYNLQMREYNKPNEPKLSSAWYI